MTLSVVIPVHNGGADFRSCLEAFRCSSLKPDEIIVVNDNSTDSSAVIAAEFANRVIDLNGGPKGPAFARNTGAEAASGDILVFIDADVMVHEDTLALIDQHFVQHPEISALFGSYDDKPAKSGLVSRYKNLQHHFVHQNGQREASTFWAGCGAIRREVFLRFGGFNTEYGKPSIEDIELGLRLKNENLHIWLCREVQVTHLKQWSFVSLLRTDIFQRAVPWTQLILSSSRLPSDLNLNLQNRLSVLAAWVFLASFVLGFVAIILWSITVVSLLVIVVLNYQCYRLCFVKGGLLFCIGSVGLHTLYFYYSSITFGLLFAHYTIRMLFRKAASVLQRAKGRGHRESANAAHQ